MVVSLDEPVLADTFGQALTRCWEGGAVAGVAFEVVERDDGYIEAHDAVHYFVGMESWPAVERWGCAQVHGRVLDVGCGAGRHAIPMQQAGTEVIGVDPSPGAVAVSRDRGAEVVHGTIANVPAELGPFDTFILRATTSD